MQKKQAVICSEIADTADVAPFAPLSALNLQGGNLFDNLTLSEISYLRIMVLDELSETQIDDEHYAFLDVIENKLHDMTLCHHKAFSPCTIR